MDCKILALIDELTPKGENNELSFKGRSLIVWQENGDVCARADDWWHP